MEERGTLMYVKCVLGLWAWLALACNGFFWAPGTSRPGLIFLLDELQFYEFKKEKKDWEVKTKVT